MKMEDNFAYGVDLGWLSQLEKRGVRWVDISGRPDLPGGPDKSGKPDRPGAADGASGGGGREVDPLYKMKELGADSVRLRVFVNPPREAFWTKKDGTQCMLGFCDRDSVLEMSRRVKKAGMRLMIDFHYSDHFADPEYQDIPAEWEKEDGEGLRRRVYRHTKEVMTLLAENGAAPDWVQVGNEINPGILLPAGSLQENPKQLVSFLNAGYEAVKECVPAAQVITHLSCVNIREVCDPFLDTFFALGGKTDILGFSYYPYWYNMIQEIRGKKVTELFYNPLIAYAEKYQKPVMIVEVGGPETDAEGTYRLLVNTIEALKQVPNGMGKGIFYWEPEVGAELLPDRYPLGAALKVGENTLEFTSALAAYGDCKKEAEAVYKNY